MRYLLAHCSEDGDVSIRLHDEIPDLEGACIHDGPAHLAEHGSDPQYWGTTGYLVFEVA